ncbi:hypothetical protein D3C74_137870 [compost metagenome]
MSEWGYILDNTDIFDMHLDEKLKKVVMSTQDCFTQENDYKLVVSFNVNLLSDSRITLVDVPIKKWESNKTTKDKIYNLLNFQLDKICNDLSDCGLNIINSTIQGEHSDVLNEIKIQISEFIPDQILSEKKKKTQKFKIKSVVPNLQFIQDTLSEYSTKRLSEIYIDWMKCIGNNKTIMSEILEIEPTEDDNILAEAFIEQYGDLGFTTKENGEILYNKFKEKAVGILEKRVAESRETEVK